MAVKKHFAQKASIGNSMVSTELVAIRPTTFSQTTTLETVGPRPSVKKPQMIGAFIGWTLLWLLVIGLGAISFFLFRFNRVAQIDWKSAWIEITSKTGSMSGNEINVKNLIILGMDSNPGFRENSLLSDVMIMIKISPHKGLAMVPIPRDLWLDSLQTRVNSLYYYGSLNRKEDGILLVNSAIGEIFNVIPDRYIMVTMDDFASLINVLGGIEVDVSKELIDNLYPKEIDVNSKDPNILYETIKFKAGKQIMSGEMALKYVRSRHSVDPEQGVDTARSLRQQEVMDAIVAAVSDPAIIYHPTKLGLIYRWYQDKLKTNLTLGEVISLGKLFISKLDGKLTSQTLKVGKPTDSQALLYHPNIGPKGQWVFLPIDDSFTKIHEWYEKL